VKAVRDEERRPRVVVAEAGDVDRVQLLGRRAVEADPKERDARAEVRVPTQVAGVVGHGRGPRGRSARRERFAGLRLLYLM
jgi:hypothetical protein